MYILVWPETFFNLHFRQIRVNKVETYKLWPGSRMKAMTNMFMPNQCGIQNGKNSGIYMKSIKSEFQLVMRTV